MRLRKYTGLLIATLIVVGCFVAPAFSQEKAANIPEKNLTSEKIMTMDVLKGDWLRPDGIRHPNQYCNYHHADPDCIPFLDRCNGPQGVLPHPSGLLHTGIDPDSFLGTGADNYRPELGQFSKV